MPAPSHPGPPRKVAGRRGRDPTRQAERLMAIRLRYTISTHLEDQGVIAGGGQRGDRPVRSEVTRVRQPPSPTDQWRMPHKLEIRPNAARRSAAPPSWRKLPARATSRVGVGEAQPVQADAVHPGACQDRMAGAAPAGV
jgi:hypothetical protein